MNKYKVYVYAICKDEERFVNRWMEGVREADDVIVTDTGSTDATVKRLTAAGAVVYREAIVPWRFDDARNAALAHVPQDADICVSCDLDEVFEPGWRRKLEDAWKPACTRARYLYTWSEGGDGAPPTRFAMEKIHRRHGFRWVHPVHEVLEYTGEEPDMSVWVEGMNVSHHPDLSKPRGQYLPLLELSARENPDDDRTAFWLGREYFYSGQYAQCIGTLKRHLSLPSAIWDEERSASMRFIASSYRAQGDNREAKAWLHRAIAECPGVREPYMELARTGYEEEDWPLTYAMVKKALDIAQPSGSYLSEPENWGYAPYDLGAVSAYYLGLLEESRAYAAEALELDSGNERLKNNLQLILERLRL